MQYSEFEQTASQHGLRVRQCSPDHWQLLGGTRHSIVNVWANSKRGFRYQIDGEKSRIGSLGEAITLAGAVLTAVETPPWKEPQAPSEVGLIRWLWKLIW